MALPLILGGAGLAISGFSAYNNAKNANRNAAANAAYQQAQLNLQAEGLQLQLDQQARQQQQQKNLTNRSLRQRRELTREQMDLAERLQEASNNMQERFQERTFNQNEAFQRESFTQAEQHQRQNIELQRQQSNQSIQLQIAQSNQSLLETYRQQRRAVMNERASILAQDEARRLTYQKEIEQAEQQIQFNNEYAGRRAAEERRKMNDAQASAAFNAQKALAKQIIAKGKIRATGRTGQSVDLLLKDAERQIGFAMAEQAASMRSKVLAAQIGMAAIASETANANRLAEANIGLNPEDSYLPELPTLPSLIDGSTFAI